MDRREFSKIMGAVVAGMVAGSKVASAATQDEGGDKHVCKGMNECKGKGGCATVAKHECKGHNECSGQGGCSSGDAGCAGKNTCKGKGGCAVPLKKDEE